MELRPLRYFGTGAGDRKRYHAARNTFLTPAASRRPRPATVAEPRNAAAESEAGDV